MFSDQPIIPAVSVCKYSQWVFNGFCDDMVNTPECNYDGGDCCNRFYSFHFSKKLDLYRTEILYFGFVKPSSFSELLL